MLDCEQQNYQTATLKLNTQKDTISVASTKNLEKNLIKSYHYDLHRLYRWMILVYVIVFAFLVGPPHLNQPPLEDIFASLGYSNELCNGKPDAKLIRGVISCKAKSISISYLPTFASNIMFVFTFIAGLLFDTVGPRICSTIGTTLLAIGWLLIGFASDSFPVHRFAMFLIGAGTDPALFGLLTAGNLFPGYTSTVFALLGTSRSLSFGHSVIFRSLVFSGIPFHFVGIGFSCLLFLGAISLWFVLPFLPYPQLPLGQDLDFEPGEGKISMKNHIKTYPSYSYRAFKQSAVEQTKDFFSLALTWKYLLFIFIPSFTLFRTMYYPQTRTFHLPNTQNYYEIMSVLSFIPCPLLGLVADKVAAAVCIMIVNFCGFLSLLISMLYTLAAEYVSITLNWIFISFVASQFYCYSRAVYPPSQMGKMAGLPLAIGGSLSLLAEKMTFYAETSSTALISMDITILAMLVLAMSLALSLLLFVEIPHKRRLKALANLEALNKEKLEI